THIHGTFGASESAPVEPGPRRCAARGRGPIRADCGRNPARGGPPGGHPFLARFLAAPGNGPRGRAHQGAALVTDRSIRFHQVSGDFKANEGMWELEPTPDGATTLLLYQAYIDPPGFVPNWLARS